MKPWIRPWMRIAITLTVLICVIDWRSGSPEPLTDYDMKLIFIAWVTCMGLQWLFRGRLR